MKTILVLYADQHPPAAIAHDVSIHRMSLARYNSSQAKRDLRGNSYMLVILDGVTQAQLRENEESFSALTQTMMTHNAVMVSASPLESVSTDIPELGGITELMEKGLAAALPADAEQIFENAALAKLDDKPLTHVQV